MHVLPMYTKINLKIIALQINKQLFRLEPKPKNC